MPLDLRLGLIAVLGLVACQGSDATTGAPAAVTTKPGSGGGGERPKGGTETELETPAPVVNCTGAAGTFYALSANRLGSTEEKMCAYEGAVVLVVNGASGCGYTPQYKPLEELYEKYKVAQGKKFAVLAFPSDSFNQELSDDKKVSEFCTNEYGITFPLFTIAPVVDDVEKKVVAQPIYKWIYSQPGMSEPVSWNFNKFLISKDGKVVKRWGSNPSPEAGGEIDKAIEAELAK